MKLYIIAGEASGDLHGSNLMKSVFRLSPNAEIQCWGGDLMEQAGGVLRKHYKDLAFMGFVEVVKNLKTILGNLSFCKKDILEFQPDALVLIDYPGFNLRIAKWAKQQGIKIFYYISPQIWAWNSKRVHAIKRDVDEMFCILPFEKAFYEKYGMDVQYVGHPLIEVVENFEMDSNSFAEKWNLDERPVIALLPGSRKQEIRQVLPIYLKMTSYFADYQFVVAGAPSQPKSFYESIIGNNPQVKIIENDTYALLHSAKAALVTSGTATLETALFKVPQVVCYKGNSISYQIAKRLVNVDFISLVNLIADKEVVKELIQEDFNEATLKRELAAILRKEEREKMLSEYEKLNGLLGKENASQKVAETILQLVPTS